MGVTDTWDPSLGEYLEKVYEHHPKNLDHNSGNPIGASISQVSALHGTRTTASDAFLSKSRSNLTVRTDSPAEKVVFDGKKAVGIIIAGKKST